MTTTVVKVNEFDVNQFNFETFPEKYKRYNKQAIMLPTLNGERCPIIQLPWVEISQYGIPSKSDLFKEDSQRYFIKLPLDDTVKSEEIKKNFFDSIDAKFGCATMRNKLIGDKSKHTYQALVRTPVTDDNKPDKMPYIKFKLQSLYPSNEITTGIVIQEHNGGEIKPVEATTIDEVLKNVPFNSKVKCFVTPSKLWYNNTCSDSYYGITFKVVKIFAKHPEKPKEQLKITNLHEHVQSDNEDVESD